MRIVIEPLLSPLFIQPALTGPRPFIPEASGG
jgi:hypothetical protein